MALACKLQRGLHLFRSNIRCITMSAQLRAEKALDDMKKANPYFDKYKDKLAALQQTSPEEFLSRMEKVTPSNVKTKPKQKERDYTELLNPKKPPTKRVDELPFKKLDDIMKIELLQDKSYKEIEHIWLEYHRTKDVIAAVITTEQFNTIMQRAREYPLFLIPIPRSEGFEFIMLQFAANTVHFTPLLCYQAHQENAPECLNIVHYTEFQDQGIVLMRGEYDVNVLNAQEAQCLGNQLQLYYAQNVDSKLALLDKFNKHPESFKHMDLIDELSNFSIDAKISVATK